MGIAAVYYHFIDMITRGQWKDTKVKNLFVVTVQNTVQVPIKITFPSQPLRRQRDTNNQHVQIQGTDSLAIVRLGRGTFSEKDQRRPGILKCYLPDVSCKRVRTLSYLILANCFPCSVRLH